MKFLRAWRVPALAALAALVVHGSGVRAPFFADDWLFLDATRSRSLGAALASRDPIGNFARPLGRQAWFWLVDRLGGGSALAFHAANLLLFVLALGLLYALARRLAGERSAAIAVAIFALTQAADVPLLWASGSQDLLALVLALGALLASEAGAGLAAGGLLALALLCKETVVLAPLVALALTARPRANWRDVARRVAPLFAAVVGWALAMRGLSMGRSFVVGQYSPSLADAILALGAFARTLAGAEYAVGVAPVLPAVAWLGLALALGAVAGAAGAPGPAPAERRRALFTGAVWALAGALPVMIVAGIWSAYYFLFALAGFALFAGSALARAPSWAAALVVFALGWGARQAASLPAFAADPDARSTLSHVNRHYVENGARQSDRLLAQLRKLHPRFAPRTTVFFSGLPAWTAFQAGDGALLRTAYRDTSLRSYYLADLTDERARRGPWRIVRYDAARQALFDQGDDPMALTSVALSMLVCDRFTVVDAALNMARARDELTPAAAYAGALRRWANGDRAGAAAGLRALGFQPRAGAGVAVAQAMRAIAAGDTALARRVAELACVDFALDGPAHALLADLWLMDPSTREPAVLEAYAALVLAPEFPFNWRRWAAVQIAYGHRPEAAASLEHYFALAPVTAREDGEAVALRASLARAASRGAR